MFLLYAIVVGLAVGFLVGGRLSGLATIEFRWAPLALLGLVVQLALFSAPISDRVGDLGPWIYIGSTLLVLIVVLRNLRVTGLPIVALGAASNLVAIVSNGGYMPISPSAAAAAGRDVATTYSNSAIVENPVLAPLTDIFGMPLWMPFHNVFSIGDVLIGIGVAVAIIAAMRRGGAGEQAGASRNLPQPRTPA
jgi:Family of unknown function (DUF5317)